MLAARCGQYDGLINTRRISFQVDGLDGGVRQHGSRPEHGDAGPGRVRRARLQADAVPTGATPEEAGALHPGTGKPRPPSALALSRRGPDGSPKFERTRQLPTEPARRADMGVRDFFPFDMSLTVTLKSSDGIR